MLLVLIPVTVIIFEDGNRRVNQHCKRLVSTSLFAAVCPTQKQPEKRSTFQVRAMDELVIDIELKHVFIKFAGALKAIYRIGITSMLQYCSYFFFGERRT